MLRVGAVDILDKTPLLDIKPYLPNTEAFPEAKNGWLSEIGGLGYEIVWSPKALETAAEIQHSFKTDLVSYVDRILSQDPLPHPYRRIRLNADSSYTIAIKYWRIDYTIEDSVVKISGIRSELPQ